jgi:hypothetical protein
VARAKGSMPRVIRAFSQIIFDQVSYVKHLHGDSILRTMFRTKWYRKLDNQNLCFYMVNRSIEKPKRNKKKREKNEVNKQKQNKTEKQTAKKW